MHTDTHLDNFSSPLIVLMFKYYQNLFKQIARLCSNKCDELFSGILLLLCHIWVPVFTDQFSHIRVHFISDGKNIKLSDLYCAISIDKALWFCLAGKIIFIAFCTNFCTNLVPLKPRQKQCKTIREGEEKSRRLSGTEYTPISNHLYADAHGCSASFRTNRSPTRSGLGLFAQRSTIYRMVSH